MITPKYEKPSRRTGPQTGEFSFEVAEAIWMRDQGRCALCGRGLFRLERGSSWSIHHRRPRGMGGTRLPWVGHPSNGVCVCGTGTTGCHGLIESHREQSTEAGFLISVNSPLRPWQVRVRHAVHGWCRLVHDGWEPADPPTYGKAVH